jgi:hypothetical protein
MVLTTTPREASQAAGPHEKVRHTTEDRIARLAAAGTEGIDRRLEQLDREWDADRALAAGAAVAALAGVALGAAVDRRFLALPAAAGGLLLHALRGWSPAAPVLRRLGYRTGAEINEERHALKVLRGDFRDLPALTPAADRDDVARFEGEGGLVAPPQETSAHDQADRAAVTEALQAARR